MKKSKTKIPAMICASLLTAVLSGCELEPALKETTSDDAQTLVDAMKYVKAKNGLCFGVVAVTRISKYRSLSIMIVPAECSKVGL